MPINKYSKLLPLRILTVLLSIAMIVIIFLKGGAYDLVIRSEFSFFRCAPEDLIQNVLLKDMLLLSYFAVIILYAFAQISVTVKDADTVRTYHPAVRIMFA